MKLKVSALLGAAALIALAAPACAQPVQFQAADAINNTPVSAATPLPVTFPNGSGSSITGPLGTQTIPNSVATTTADGAQVTIGTTSDAACATDTGTCSLIALQKKGNQNGTTLNTTAGAALAAGGNTIGGTIPTSATTGGVTAYTLTAANSTNATNVKASAGNLYHIAVYNNSATLAWVSFYNTAGTPTCGTSIVYQTMIPANSTSGAGAVENFTTGLAFPTGIGICVATGIAGTGSVAASSYVVGLGYK